jgi:hypothetical protein
MSPTNHHLLGCFQSDSVRRDLFSFSFLPTDLLSQVFLQLRLPVGGSRGKHQRPTHSRIFIGGMRISVPFSRRGCEDRSSSPRRPRWPGGMPPLFGRTTGTSLPSEATFCQLPSSRSPFWFASNDRIITKSDSLHYRQHHLPGTAHPARSPTTRLRNISPAIPAYRICH